MIVLRCAVAAGLLVLPLGVRGDAMDPYFNFPTLLEHAFLQEMWEPERITEFRWGVGIWPDDLTETVALVGTSEKFEPGDRLSCGDVVATSVKGADALPEAIREQGWNNIGTPVWTAARHGSDERGITDFAASVAVLQPSLDPARVIDPATGGLTAAAEARVRKIEGWQHAQMLDEALAGVRMRVIGTTDCTDGFTIVHIEGKRDG